MLSRIRFFVTPWTAACQASLSITTSRSLLKLMSIKLVMPSNHLILCRPLLFPPSIFPSIRVFSNESVLHIRWPKYWCFSFSISPSSEHQSFQWISKDWFPLGWTGWISFVWLSFFTPSFFTWNCHNIVNWLFTNTKQKSFLKKIFKESMDENDNIL